MKRLFLLFWGIWDFIYYRFNRMQYISPDDNILRIVRKKYKGSPLQTNSGEWIKNGDEVIKIHIYNYGLAKMVHNCSSEISLALYLKKNIQQSMQGLCCYIYTLPDHQEIKGVLGTSMLNRGADRLGFSVHDVPASFYFKYKSFLFKLIYLIVHPQGFKYIKKHGKRLHSKHLVMSINELFQHYSR